jgi:hypothetical protein
MSTFLMVDLTGKEGGRCRGIGLKTRVVLSDPFNRCQTRCKTVRLCCLSVLFKLVRIYCVCPVYLVWP